MQTVTISGPMDKVAELRRFIAVSFSIEAVGPTLRGNGKSVIYFTTESWTTITDVLMSAARNNGCSVLVDPE